MSATLTLSKDKKLAFTNSSEGTSLDQKIIIKKAQEATKHRQKPLWLKYPVVVYLFSSSSPYEFEDKVETIYNQLLEGFTPFSNLDIKILEDNIDKLEISQMLALVRICGPLLESEHHFQEASSMLKKLLQHSCPEVRYAALEAISFALGEASIAESMLEEAKDILKSETSSFVLDYLESL